MQQCDRKTRIAVIGSGNVATHLSRGFAEAGCEIVQVYSREKDHALRLAGCFDGCDAIDNVSCIVADADFYLISTADAVVHEMAVAMRHVDGIVVHTSGSVPLEALTPASDRIAVLYPLQTFTREACVDLSEIPFFTEASDTSTLACVDKLARMLSSRISHADSSQRRILHLAGVLSCNFVNFLWDSSDELLKKAGYDFSVLKPLINATLDKAAAIGPHNAQTGPAMRCDIEVIRSQADSLDQGLREIYLALTRAIVEKHDLQCEV